MKELRKVIAENLQLEDVPVQLQESDRLFADLNIDYAFTPKTTFTLYLAAAKGDEVIDSIYAGRSGTMAYFEVLRRF